MMRYTGDRPCRTTSPHDAPATAAKARRMIGVLKRVIACSSPDDAWCDEDQQLRALIVDPVALEQPAEKRNLAQTWRPIGLVLQTVGIHAADHGRLAVAHEQRRDGALRVDRRDCGRTGSAS